MKIFTPEQMRAFDKSASAEYHIPSIVLMENAALRVVEFIEAKFAPLWGKPILVLCGKGNNGGDGFAIARHLDAAGCDVWVAASAPISQMNGDALTNRKILESIEHRGSVQIIDIQSDDERPFYQRFPNWHFDIVIDAVLGTGITGKIRDSPTLGTVNLSPGHPPPTTRIAVDIPSGLNATTGRAQHAGGSIDNPCADYTITFAAPKRGMLVRDGLATCGEIWVGDIGAPEALMHDTETGMECITREKARDLLPRRAIDAHKGDAGRVLMIGGSLGMSGAIALASRASLKVGAGLCTAALPDKILSTFASSVLEATSHPLPCDQHGRLVAEAADELPELWGKVQAVAIGPGISRSDTTLELVRRVVRECPQPLIIDADALYALHDMAEEVKAREAETILTPHPGEMAELMRVRSFEVRDERFEIARACAEKYGATVVLKGARSLVACPTGHDWEFDDTTGDGWPAAPITFVNLTGNAGMATGGSGDALAGTIAGILAQLKDAAKATIFSVYLHGLAGDIAARTRGNGLTAGDIVDNLPAALLELENGASMPTINHRLRLLA